MAKGLENSVGLAWLIYRQGETVPGVPWPLFLWFLFLLHSNLHSAAFQLAAQIVMKVFQFSTLMVESFVKKLHYKAREGES